MNKRKRKKQIIALIIAGAAIALVVFGVLRIRKARSELQRASANQSISSAVVTQQNIRTRVVGNGTLEEGSVEDLKMPKGIKVKEILVDTGDLVRENQVLLRVDHSSVRDAIADVQSQINRIDAELLKMEDQKTDEDLKAPVSGFIKTVYVENGSTVSNAMDQNGALLVITSDDDAREVRITALSGDVKEVHVGEGSHVSQGDSLITLRAVQDEVNRGKLLTQREELTGLMNVLYDLSRTDEITSDRAGIVREIYAKEGETLTDASSLPKDTGVSASVPAQDPVSYFSSLFGSGSTMSTKGAKSALQSMFLFVDSSFEVSPDGGEEQGDGTSIADDPGGQYPAGPDGENDGAGTDGSSQTFSGGDGSGAEGGYDAGGPDFSSDSPYITEGDFDPGAGSDDVEEGVEVETPDGRDTLPDSSGADAPDAGNIFLSGPFFLPIRMPAAGSLPMQLEEAASYLSGAVYSITSLNWNIGPDQVFEPGGRYTASVTLRTNTDNHVFLSDASAQNGVVALGISSFDCSASDSDGDGLLEEMHVDMFYPALAGAPSGNTAASDGNAAVSDDNLNNTPSVDLNNLQNLSDLIGGGTGMPDLSSYLNPNGIGAEDLAALLGNRTGGENSASLLPLLSLLLGGTDLSSLLPAGTSGQSIGQSIGQSLGQLISQGLGGLDLATLLGEGMNGQSLSQLLTQMLSGTDIQSLIGAGLSGLGNNAGLAALLGLAGDSGLGDLSSLTGSLDLSGLSADSLAGSVSGSVSAAGLTAYADAPAFSIAGAEKMDVTIGINELDILAIAKGQSAEVTMDAIEGETFDGIVTEISKTGTNTGGVTKYQVTVEIGRDDRMRPDMSCTVSILVDEAIGVSVVPTAAVFTEQGKNYVYTSKEDDGTLSGKTEIGTGIADGEYVEVLTGLADGQTVYYRNKAVNYLDLMVGNRDD